ncbi:hypothetical protein NOK12_39270 [Nocardioides sp. OK12]|nr:hypothetical protein NOK12_39270 [Nocardioides sp. OK12]
MPAVPTGNHGEAHPQYHDPWYSFRRMGWDWKDVRYRERVG